MLTATRPALVRQFLAAHKPATKDAADLIIERIAEDARGNHSTECGLLRHELRKALTAAGDTDIPRDPCLDGYNRVQVDGVELELGWLWRYGCVEVVEAWHNGDNIARFLGDTKLQVLADHLVFEVL